MTETLDPMAVEVDQKQLAEHLLAQAKERRRGVSSIRRSSRCGTTRGARTRPFLDYDVEIRRVVCEGVCDRVGQRLPQACCARLWALPDRAGGSRVSVSRHAGTGPHRER